MSVAVVVFFALLLSYAVVLLWLASGFLRTSRFSAHKETSAPITIIICARNEEKNIALCLSSILKQEYDLARLQILLINDASSDATVQRAENILRTSGISYKIISNQQQKGKKKSISYAMQFAAHELIVLRDADTFTRSTTWLRSIAGLYQHSRPDLIIGPVAIADNSGLLWALQAIENNVLSLAACGSAFYKKPFLCSGANLVVTKSSFERSKAYASNMEIASGDDIFLLEGIKRMKGAIVYLKNEEAIVYTYPEFMLRDVFRQKIRWASKLGKNRNVLNTSLAVLSFSVNLAWLFCFVFVNRLGFHNSFLLFIYLKLFIDILLLFLASGFIKNKNLLWFSLPVSFIYPVYAGAIGIASLFIKPKWK